MPLARPEFVLIYGATYSPRLAEVCTRHQPARTLVTNFATDPFNPVFSLLCDNFVKMEVVEALLVAESVTFELLDSFLPR